MFSECHVFEPPNPVKQFYYKCDKVFHLDELVKLYIKHDTYAIVLISGKRTDFYSYCENNTKLIKSITVTLPNQFKTGGSSAARLGRVRDEKIGWYLKSVVELMIKLLIQDGIFQHLGLILAGPSDLKLQIQSNHLFSPFQKHLQQVVTISEINDQSVYEVINVIKDKNDNMDDFEQLFLHDKVNLLVFGIDVFRQLCEIEELFIHSNATHLLDQDYGKIKITIINNNLFMEKYGEVVGLRYYENYHEEIEESI